MSIVLYGITVFLIIRHVQNIWISNIVIPVTIVICLLSGISPIYFGTQYPSGVTAGYVFGGAIII